MSETSSTCTVEYDWQRVPGRVIEGHQVASGRSAERVYPAGTIEMQLPAFKQLGLDLTPYHPATINISIAPYEFEMRSPELRLEQVHWTDLHPPETFSFSRCRLIFGSNVYHGLVYYPHPETKARHFKDASHIEILTSLVEGLAYGSALELDLRKDEIALRLKSQPA